MMKLLMEIAIVIIMILLIVTSKYKYNNGNNFIDSKNIYKNSYYNRDNYEKNLQRINNDVIEL